jgi:hypothetical protein
MLAGEILFLAVAFELSDNCILPRENAKVRLWSATKWQRSHFQPRARGLTVRGNGSVGYENVDAAPPTCAFRRQRI